jgi:hypothetical protein
MPLVRRADEIDNLSEFSFVVVILDSDAQFSRAGRRFLLQISFFYACSKSGSGPNIK